MNAIESKFLEALISVASNEYILQHAKGMYKVIGTTEVLGEEDEPCDCSCYVKIKYQAYIRKEETMSGVICLYITAQGNVSGYKVDFLLSADVPNISCGIEIDGHEWHERTKGQASEDKKRERKLLSLGIPCIRFTGSDVFTNADGCAKEALDIFFNYYFELLLSTPENWDAYIKGNY